jgi:hypothetical protein
MRTTGKPLTELDRATLRSFALQLGRSALLSLLRLRAADLDAAEIAQAWMSRRALHPSGVSSLKPGSVVTHPTGPALDGPADDEGEPEWWHAMQAAAGCGSEDR